MKVPFTTEQFFGIFEKYNATVFPAQWIILALGILSLVLLHGNLPSKSKIIGGVLGAIWIWTGLVYHISFFTGINKAAYAFGGLFVVEGVLILVDSLRSRLEFAVGSRSKDKAGYFFILFALFVYPVIGYLVEHSSGRLIMLGLPCPSTIFTFGLLMLTSRRFSVLLLVIPTLWAVIGLSAAINFGVYQDYMLIVSAIVANVTILRRKAYIE